MATRILLAGFCLLKDRVVPQLNSLVDFRQVLAILALGVAVICSGPLSGPAAAAQTDGLPLLAEAQPLLDVTPLDVTPLDVTVLPQTDIDFQADWQDAIATADDAEQPDVAPVPEPTAGVLLGGICMLLLLMTFLRRRFDQLAPLPIDRS